MAFAFMSVLGEFPARLAIIDGEIVASNAAGIPDFWPLFLGSAKLTELHVWECLRALLSRFGYPTVLASESFNDDQALLGVAEKHGLEGVVRKAL
jgi:ATP-dependent DNA ligase